MTMLTRMSVESPVHGNMHAGFGGAGRGNGLADKAAPRPGSTLVLGFSYGFRPGRNPHQALDALAVGISRRKVNWVLDAEPVGPDLRNERSMGRREASSHGASHCTGDKQRTKAVGPRASWLDLAAGGAGSRSPSPHDDHSDVVIVGWPVDSPITRTLIASFVTILRRKPATLARDSGRRECGPVPVAIRVQRGTWQ